LSCRARVASNPHHSAGRIGCATGGMPESRFRLSALTALAVRSGGEKPFLVHSGDARNLSLTPPDFHTSALKVWDSWAEVAPSYNTALATVGVATVLGARVLGFIVWWGCIVSGVVQRLSILPTTHLRGADCFTVRTLPQCDVCFFFGFFHSMDNTVAFVGTPPSDKERNLTLTL
jgi:hypothetical protein